MTRLPIGGLLCAMAFTATPCLGQVTGKVRPAKALAPTGATLTISVDVDLGTSGKLLGSYGATLNWDTTVLQYLTDSGGGQSPFDTAVVNRTDVGAGVLKFADASPTGAGGLVNIFNVTFRICAVAEPTATLDLEFTSLGAPGPTFENLLPILAVQDGTVDVADFLFDLRVAGQTDTILHWEAIPGALSYDVIRGEISQVFLDSHFVHLGTVTCLENDSQDTTTGLGTEPPSPDAATPALGDAFIYLVRFHDGVRNSAYGFTAQCARERVVDLGDCP